MKKDLENFGIDQGTDSGYDQNDTEKEQQEAAEKEAEVIRKKKEEDAIVAALSAFDEDMKKKIEDLVEQSAEEFLKAIKSDRSEKESVDQDEDSDVDNEKDNPDEGDSPDVDRGDDDWGWGGVD